MVLFVLSAAAASAAPPVPPLRVLLRLPLAEADSYTLADGMLLVHAPRDGTLTAYDLATGHRTWRAAAGVPAYQVRSGDGLVLLRRRGTPGPDLGTVALSATTGQVRWRVDESILVIAGAPTVLAVSQVRSIAGEGRRVEGPVSGLDPVTGQPRWTLPVASTAVVLAMPGGAAALTPRLLLVHDSGLAELHDLGTGRRLAAVRFPPADYGPGDPAVIGGMLLLRHPAAHGSLVSAYDPTTLRRQWRRATEVADDLGNCGGLACLIGPSGVRALDPANGAERWHRPGWRGIEQRDGALLAYGQLSGDSDLVGLIDAETGRIALPLPHWRPVPGTAGGDRLLVTRAGGSAGRTMVAVADPTASRPRPLGELAAGTADCRAVPHRLACRVSGGELVVWSYSWR